MPPLVEGNRAEISWVPVTTGAADTSTPNNPTFGPEDIGKTFWVRGAWVSPRGELGPFSEPSSVTIPG